MLSRICCCDFYLFSSVLESLDSRELVFFLFVRVVIVKKSHVPRNLEMDTGCLFFLVSMFLKSPDRPMS